MPTTPRRLSRSLIALAAIVVASSFSQVAACVEMKRNPGACAPACDCCRTDAGSGSEAIAATAPVRMVTEIGVASRSGQGCECRAQAPAAPLPRPARSPSTSRPEPVTHGDLVVPGLMYTARPRPVAAVPAHSIAPNTPLYLRMERLLF